MPKSSYGMLEFLKNRTKAYINEKRSKKISIKGILRFLFLKPPFIGEFIFVILLLTAWLWTLISTPSLIDLGTMSVSLLTDDEIKEYKENMLKGIISELESKGISISNLKLSDETIENFATVSFLKTSGEEDQPGKNLVYLNDKSGKIDFSKNTTETYYYLDNLGNTKQINYSSTYVKIDRLTSRWKATQSDLINKYKKFNGKKFEESDLDSCFEIVTNEYGNDSTAESLEIAISNILDPFLVKSNILLYLYTSTNNSELCENFIENEKLNSEIILEEIEATVTSSGTPNAVKVTKDFEITFFKNADNLSYVRQSLSDGDYVAENGEIYSVIIDENGNKTSERDETIATYSPSGTSAYQIRNYLGIKDSGTESDLTLSNFEDENIKDKTIIQQDGNKYTVYTGKVERFFTYCKSSAPIYLVKEAKTWFGNFQFENKVSSDGGIKYILPVSKDSNKEGGQIGGITIESICSFTVNEEAKKEFLELFNGQNGSSLSDISIFAEQLKQSAIENNDYNLKLTYYGLCKMMEDVDGVNINMDEDIKNQIENNGKVEIDTIPSNVYNILISTAKIPDFEIRNGYSYGAIIQMADKSDELFNEYTMPYGANYKTDFPTRTVNLYADLNVPSGLTLEEFYKIAEYYAQKRYPNLETKTSGEENMKFCYELAEAAYYIEQDVGINGLYILASSVKEGAWGASYFSIERANLWGYGITGSGSSIGNDYHTYSLYPDELNEKYKSPHQRCAYVVAVYLKCLYLTDYNDVAQYIDKLPGKNKTEKCNNLKSEELYIRNRLTITNDMMTDQEFEEFLVNNNVDANAEKIFRLYRNWCNAIGYKAQIGCFYSPYGPTVYGIDGIYVRVWRYEAKDYGLTTYRIMENLYEVAVS